LQENNKWYKTRKPRLRLKILAYLVLNGKQTKSTIKHLLKTKNYADIYTAFEELDSAGRIKKLEEAKFGSGLPQPYYKITSKGLELLITDDPHPLKFWKAILGYCHHYSTGGLTRDEIDNYTEHFLKKYLKYKNRDFSFQLDIFDNMCNKWFHEMIQKPIEISVEQKIVEVLALHRGITFEQLVEMAEANKSDIRNCLLSTYTLESYTPLVDKTVYIYQNVIGKRYNKKYWDFLLHNTVAIKDNKGSTEVYELSLFGIILALTLIRFHDMGKLIHGLYNNNISFGDYYDRIAENYADKLPLIFEKWKLLKDTLRIYSAYNFDVIINTEIRMRDSDRDSVIRGGNRELIDSVKEIVLQTREQLGALANAGQTVWLNYASAVPYKFEVQKNKFEDYMLTHDIDIQGQPDQERCKAVRKKLTEILLGLNPIEQGFSGSIKVQPNELREISKQFEEQFADEITALYYFHLFYEYEFNTRVSTPKKYYSSIDLDNRVPVSLMPKKCLSLILQKDKGRPSLREWFYRWMRDINNLQSEVSQALNMIK